MVNTSAIQYTHSYNDIKYYDALANIMSDLFGCLYSHFSIQYVIVRGQVQGLYTI